MSASECVRKGNKKKRTKLVFSKRKKHSIRRGKTNSSKENFSI